MLYNIMILFLILKTESFYQSLFVHLMIQLSWRFIGLWFADNTVTYSHGYASRWEAWNLIPSHAQTH